MINAEILETVREKAVWEYRYAYRNTITGHVSNAVPWISDLRHTFAYPESDVVNIYKQMQDGSFNYDGTLEEYKG